MCLRTWGGSSYGDWCWVPETTQCSHYLSASFSMLENLMQMQVLAGALGQHKDLHTYTTYLQSFSKAFHGESTSPLGAYHARHCFHFDGQASRDTQART